MPKTLLLDPDRCVGCGACVVSCMDQNDIYPEQGLPPFRRVLRHEQPDCPTGGSRIGYASVGCRHCVESPCLIGCPSGAIYRDEQSGAILVAAELCIGCHSCALACPFGVPRYDSMDRMRKCNMCAGRLEAGLQPACVKVCPFKALLYVDVNELQKEREALYLDKVSACPNPQLL